jgi:Yip1-like protein
MFWLSENRPKWLIAVPILAGGVSRTLMRLGDAPVELALTPEQILATVAIAGPLVGLMIVFVVGRLLHLVLGFMGGQATWVQSRTVIAWALAPGIPACALWLVMIATHGLAAIGPLKTESTPFLLQFDYFVQFSFMLWTLILEVMGLAGIHRVSVWRIIVAELMLGVGLLVVLLGVMMLF